MGEIKLSDMTDKQLWDAIDEENNRLNADWNRPWELEMEALCHESNARMSARYKPE